MSRATLARLFLAALAVRAAFLLLEPRSLQMGDEGMWRHMARELASPEVGFSPFRTQLLSHPPLYPYFLAGMIRLVDTFQHVKWAQILLDALLVPAVALVGARLSGPRVGVLAAAIAALCPELVWHSTHFWSEVLLLPLLWWAFERVLCADARGRAVAAAVGGLLFGLAILTRETLLYFAPLVAIWLGWRRPPRIRLGAAFLLACTLVIAPWTYRNYAMFGAFVPVANRGNIRILLGNSDRPWEEIFSEYSRFGPVEGPRRALAEGLREAWSHPLPWYPRKAFRELAAYWGVNNLSVIHLEKEAYGPLPAQARRLAAALTIVPYLALVALAVVGAAGTRLDRARVLVLGFALLYTLMHVVVFGFPRFRLPVLPVLFLLAAEAWTRLREGPPLGRRRTLAAVAFALVAAALLFPSLVDTWRHPVFRTAPVAVHRTAARTG